MDEEINSWIRRTKFSHTICHRLDATRLSSIPITFQPRSIASAKTRPETGSLNSRTSLVVRQIVQNPSTNKQRVLSPLPKTKLSDTFKEARSSQRRFSTPHPQRKEHEKGNVSKLFLKDSRDKKAPSSTVKFNDKLKSRNRKDSAWSKYFDHSGRRVMSVETADEYTIDLSKLFLGLRFAHGAHSQLYHGIYSDEPVAVKMIRLPDDDENGDLATRLENQFSREVTLLSQLHHQNVVKVENRLPCLMHSI